MPRIHLSGLCGTVIYSLGDQEAGFSEHILLHSRYSLLPLANILAVFLFMTTEHRHEAELSLREAQMQVDGWIKTYGVRYFGELTNMAILTEEVGELARVMARKYGDQSFKAGESHELGDEMADVLWVLLCLANQTGVDLTEAFARNLEKKTSRDKTRHINNPKLNGTDNK